MKKTKTTKILENEFFQLVQEAKACNVPSEKFKTTTLEKVIIICSLSLFVLMVVNLILSVFSFYEYNYVIYIFASISVPLFCVYTALYQKRVTPILKEEISKIKYRTSTEG
jgi:hypothetical protein